MLISQKHALCGLCRRAGGCKSVYECACVLVHYWFASLCTFFALRKAEKVSGKWRSGQGEKYVWRVLPHRNTEWLFNPTFPRCYISNHKHGCKLHAQAKVRFFQTFPAACRPGNFLKLWIIAMLSGRYHCSASCKTLMMLGAPWNLFYFSTDSLFFSFW